MQKCKIRKKHRVRDKMCKGLGPCDPPSFIPNVKGRAHSHNRCDTTELPPYIKKNGIFSENKFRRATPRAGNLPCATEKRMQNARHIRAGACRCTTHRTAPLYICKKNGKNPKIIFAARGKSAACDRKTDAKCGAHSCKGKPVRDTPMAQDTPKYLHQKFPKHAIWRPPKIKTSKGKNG